MEITKYINEFTAQGYSIVPIENINIVNESRNFISNYISKKYKVTGSSEYILNHCHELIDQITDSKVNQFILEIINEFSKYYKMDQIIYSSCATFLERILGPDIASQKHPNIVFQYPNSERISELHSDAPANSFYEIVSWLPLVNCYSSKSFYILDKNKSFSLLSSYRNNQFNSFKELRAQAIKEATHLEVDYGHALFFWSGLLHGSVINKTNESRWSYNVRYKNLFAPAGLKEPLSFYNIFSKSAITELASELI